MKTKPPSISDVQKLLEDMRSKDPEAFDSIISHQAESKSDRKVYSLLQVMNELYGNESIRIGCYYDRVTGKTEKIIICDEATVQKHADGHIPKL